MNDGIHERIADRIRTARAERGLSQNDLAGRIGVSSQQFHKYETAKNEVRASCLVRIAQALDRPLSFFFEDGLPEGALLAGSSRGRITLLHAYEELDGANRALLISLAKSLAEATRQKPIAP
jgi:transcriptional regulator with XRE-family HTH domain